MLSYRKIRQMAGSAIKLKKKLKDPSHRAEPEILGHPQWDDAVATDTVHSLGHEPSCLVDTFRFFRSALDGRAGGKRNIFGFSTFPTCNFGCSMKTRNCRFGGVGGDVLPLVAQNCRFAKCQKICRFGSDGDVRILNTRHCRFGIDSVRSLRTQNCRFEFAT